MVANDLDYSCMMKACGLAGRGVEKPTVKKWVSHFLNQTLSETMIEFGTKLETTASKIRSLSLAQYREQDEFRAAWQFVNMPPPLRDWDFLSHTDPEKTGVLCGEPGREPTLLTAENVNPLFDMKTLEDTVAFDLWVSLSWWRTAVSCVWAGKIVHDLLLRMRTRTERCLLIGDTIFSKENFFEKTIRNDKPIGAILALPGSNEKDAEEFYAFCDRAHMGSRDCEYRAAAELKDWLHLANIGIFQESGLNFKQAHLLLLAATQREPRIDMKLAWDQSSRAYQFVCLVENNDRHGYTDKEKTSGIPAELLMNFFGSASGKIREGLFRLVLRAGSIKARELFSGGLDRID